MRRAPLLFVAAVLAVLAYGAWEQLRRRPFAEAVEVLLDGAPDRDERLAMLRVVAEHGVAESARTGRGLPRLQAAVAALLLGTEGARLPPLGGDLKSLDADELRQAALDEPSVWHLLRGRLEEQAGRLERARLELAQAEASARLYELPQIAELARTK